MQALRRQILPHLLGRLAVILLCALLPAACRPAAAPPPTLTAALPPPLMETPAVPTPADPTTPLPTTAPTVAPTATTAIVRPIGDSPRPADGAIPVTPTPERRTHLVRAGETLSEIAEQYGVSTADLARFNGITDPNRVVVGALLEIPTTADLTAPTATPAATTTYIVQPGDQLGRIAEQFGVSLDDLIAANGIADPNTITVGRTLTIPGR